MATREEVRRTDNSKLGREVLNHRSSIMRGLRGKVDVAAEVEKVEKVEKKKIAAEVEKVEKVEKKKKTKKAK